MSNPVIGIQCVDDNLGCIFGRPQSVSVTVHRFASVNEQNDVFIDGGGSLGVPGAKPGVVTPTLPRVASGRVGNHYSLFVSKILPLQELVFILIAPESVGELLVVGLKWVFRAASCHSYACAVHVHLYGLRIRELDIDIFLRSNGDFIEPVIS